MAGGKLVRAERGAMVVLVADTDAIAAAGDAAAPPRFGVTWLFDAISASAAAPEASAAAAARRSTHGAA